MSVPERERLLVLADLEAIYQRERTVQGPQRDRPSGIPRSDPGPARKDAITALGLSDGGQAAHQIGRRPTDVWPCQIRSAMLPRSIIG